MDHLPRQVEVAPAVELLRHLASLLLGSMRTWDLATLREHGRNYETSEYKTLEIEIEIEIAKR